MKFLNSNNYKVIGKRTTELFLLCNALCKFSIFILLFFMNILFCDLKKFLFINRPLQYFELSMNERELNHKSEYTSPRKS